MTGSHWLIVVLAILSVYNCGVIWPTQRVTYPLFELVSSDQFLAYHRFYNRRITPVVIIPGFLFFLAPLTLLVFRPPSVPMWAIVLSIVLGLVALLVTVGLEIPRHIRLQQQGKTDTLIQELIVYNWVRTFAITAQAVLILWMLTRTFVPVAG